MYKTTFNGTTHAYNLRNVNAIELNKTTVIMSFNVCKPKGFFMLGSGNLDCELHEEKLRFKDETYAQKAFEDISDAIDKLD